MDHTQHFPAMGAYRLGVFFDFQSYHGGYYYMKEGGCKEGNFPDDGTIQGAASLFRVDSSIRFLIASVFLAVSHRFSKSFSWATWAIAIRALR